MPKCDKVREESHVINPKLGPRFTIVASHGKNNPRFVVDVVRSISSYDR